jgi:hypothetical protein
MPARIEFTPEQVERLKGPEGHQALADAFGISNMPIRRWRKRHGWRATAPVAPENGPDELELLKHENAELRKVVRKGSRTDLGDERVLRAIERAIERVEPVYLRPLGSGVSASAEAHHRQIAMWSDWHYGEHVDAESVSDINAYSVAICEDRVAQLVKSILSFKKVRPALTGLDIFIMGDMATGKIHRLEETNEVPAQEQYVRVGYLIAWAVEQLAPHYPQIDIYCTWGNHPRDTPEPSTSHSNGDWVACQLAKAATGHLSNVHWSIPKAGMVVATVADLNFLVWHGDGIRSNSAGVPWMAMAKRAALLRDTYADAGTRVHYLAVGHYHQQAAVPGLFMNGSLIGPNAHGMKNYGGGARPNQLLITLDERKRRVTDVSYCTPE